MSGKPSRSKICAVPIDGNALVDWDSFHTIFSEKLGFPDYYGRNLNAWHDCFYSLAEESTVLDLAPGDVVLLEVTNFTALKARLPEVSEFILEGSAFVNFILQEARQDSDQPYGRLGAVAVSAYE